MPNALAAWQEKAKPSTDYKHCRFPIADFRFCWNVRRPLVCRTFQQSAIGDRKLAIVHAGLLNRFGSIGTFSFISVTFRTPLKDGSTAEKRIVNGSFMPSTSL